MTPQVTWKPWKPVIVKNVEPYKPAVAAPYLTGSLTACSASVDPSRKAAGEKPCPTSVMYAATCTHTNDAPASIVDNSHSFSPPWSAGEIAANAFTIDTEEQISRNVLRAES